MTEITQFALAGLRTAETRLAVRAKNIVNAYTPGYEPDRFTQISTNAGPVPTVLPGKQLTAYHSGEQSFSEIAVTNKVNLAAEIIDFKLAEISYKASIAVLKTANELDRALLEIFA